MNIGSKELRIEAWMDLRVGSDVSEPGWGLEASHNVSMIACRLGIGTGKKVAHFFSVCRRSTRRQPVIVTTRKRFLEEKQNVVRFFECHGRAVQALRKSWPWMR